MSNKNSRINNYLSLPRIDKIVVSVGLGEHKENKELTESIGKEIAEITGQKPKIARAKKSISGFKIRENQHIGYVVTLRGKTMNGFLNKLIKVVLPRVRDFDGINEKSLDKCGNLNFSIKEQVFFPEIKPDESKCVWGMTITISLKKKTDPVIAKDYFKKLGFIFKGGENG